MFLSKGNLVNRTIFGDGVFDSIEIVNSGISLDIYDTSSNSIVRVDNTGGGTMTVTNLNVTGSFSGGSFPTISLDDGSAAAPSLNFTNSATTGLYHVGGGEIGISSNASPMLQLLNTVGIKAFRPIIMTDSNSTGNIKISGLSDNDGNTSIGYSSGDNLNAGGLTGNYNTLYGYKSGLGITTGNNNLCVGKLSGTSITTGSNNVMIGELAAPGDEQVFEVEAKTSTIGNYLNQYVDFDIINPSTGLFSSYRIWFQTSGGDTQPGGGGIGIEVDIQGLGSTTDIAAAIATAVDAVDGVSSTSSGAIATISNNYAGIINAAPNDSDGTNLILTTTVITPGTGGSIDDKLIIRNLNTSLIEGDFSSEELYFNSGISNKVRTTDSNSFTLTYSDYMVRCSYNLGTTTITLPSIIQGKSHTFIIVNVTTNPRTININRGGSDTIGASLTTFSLNLQNDRVILTSDGQSPGIWYPM